MRLLTSCEGMIAVSIRFTSSAAIRKFSAVSSMSPRASAAYGLPCSSESSRAKSSRRSTIRSAIAWQIFARSQAVSAAHFGCAARAAATARPTSSTLASGASASVSPVTGETTARALSPVEATHSPPMKFSSVRTVTAMSDLHFDRLELLLELGQLAASGHQPDELFAVDLRLLVHAETLAAVQDHEPVAHRIGVMRVVRDEDDGHASFARLQDVLEHDTGLLHAERRRGLVEDQHARSEVDRPCDRDRLALATGQRADRLVGVANVDSHLAQLAAHDALGFRRVEPLKRPVTLPRLGAEEKVPPDRHQRHHRKIVVDGRHALRARVSR